MKYLRFQRKRVILTVVCVALIFILQYYLFGHSTSTLDCVVPAAVHERMPNMLEKIQNALDALHVSYFLCYGSLWGALKIGGPLPWQKNIDLCVLNKDVSEIDEVFLVRTFKRYGLDIHYNIASGVYTVSMFKYEFPTATLFVFEEDSVTRQMRRVGWTHRVLPPNACDTLHCFPPDLISPPLPHVKFSHIKLPCPREEIEIQKYLFPNSWWKEIKPTDCN